MRLLTGCRESSALRAKNLQEFGNIATNRSLIKQPIDQRRRGAHQTAVLSNRPLHPVDQTLKRRIGWRLVSKQLGQSCFKEVAQRAVRRPGSEGSIRAIRCAIACASARQARCTSGPFALLRADLAPCCNGCARMVASNSLVLDIDAMDRPAGSTEVT